MEALIEQLSETRFNKIEHVSEIGSTNSDLASKASTLPDGFTLIADHQTAGRGRMGRNWEAPPSTNLLFSVLCRDAYNPFASVSRIQTAPSSVRCML